MADPYQILGVTRTASEAEIKSAYRTLAKQLHPDRNQDNPDAAARFSEITRAYDVLGDADKRARFDRGEIDIDGNPAHPFGAGGFGALVFQGLLSSALDLVLLGVVPTIALAVVVDALFALWGAWLKGEAND